MKTPITILAIMLTTILTAQTVVNLSGMTQDVTLGQNCSNSQAQQEFVTYLDVNLNGKKLDLRNAHLTVYANINGNGRIEGCGNSKICTTGAIQNNPVFDDVEIVNCSVLNLPEFEFGKYGYNYQVYDITGRLISQGIIDENTHNLMPINQMLFIKVEGFVVKKFLIQ